MRSGEVRVRWSGEMSRSMKLLLLMLLVPRLVDVDDGFRLLLVLRVVGLVLRVNAGGRTLGTLCFALLLVLVTTRAGLCWLFLRLASFEADDERVTLERVVCVLLATSLIPVVSLLATVSRDVLTGTMGACCRDVEEDDAFRKEANIF